MKLSLACFLGAIGVTSAASNNPFAPKVTPNNAAAKYSSSLMRGAKTLRAPGSSRNLEGDDADIDLTNYSIKFEKCQFVKEFAGEGEEGGGEDGQFLVTKRFVIFRLCPNNQCSSCSSNYGEYLIDLETYLEATTEFVNEQQEQYCETCNTCYEQAYNNQNNNNGDNNNGDNEDAWMCQNFGSTDSCYAECQNIENMEENGYVDASEFLECQRLEGDENQAAEYDQYGNQIEYYAGPVCASGGSRIKIGVYYDENCSYLVENKDIDSYMQRNDNGVAMQLSYHALKMTFPDSGNCVASCKQEDEENNNQNQNNGDGNYYYQQYETAEVCRNLYEAAGKCESIHGFSAMRSYNNQNQNNGENNNQNYYQGWYENQLKNEEAVCNYMDNVQSGIYSLSGDINVVGGRSVSGGGSATTGGQKFALTFFVLGSIGMAGYAAMLHQQLTKGSKAALAQQGGAMA